MTPKLNTRLNTRDREVETEEVETDEVLDSEAADAANSVVLDRAMTTDEAVAKTKETDEAEDTETEMIDEEVEMIDEDNF